MERFRYSISGTISKVFSTSSAVALIQPLRRMGLQDAHAGQFQVGAQVVGLVIGGGEAELRLENAKLVEVHVYHGLLELGEAQPGSLHAVPVGYIYKINLTHITLSSCQRINSMKYYSIVAGIYFK